MKTSENTPESATKSTTSSSMAWLDAIHRLILTAWVGVTWTVGFLAAPLAFSVIQPQSLAGTFASHIFYWQSVIALFCAAVILLLHPHIERRLQWSKQLVIMILFIAALAALQQFVVAPIMAGTRVELMSAVNESTRAALASRFAWLHGLSSVLYLLQCLLGAVLVVKGR